MVKLLASANRTNRAQIALHEDAHLIGLKSHANGAAAEEYVATAVFALALFGKTSLHDVIGLCIARSNPSRQGSI